MGKSRLESLVAQGTLNRRIPLKRDGVQCDAADQIPEETGHSAQQNTDRNEVISGRAAGNEKPCNPNGLHGSGAAGQIRTADLILTKDALYLLSYSSKKYAPLKGAYWRPRRDLNPRPPA